jgi:hypothetical protein
MSSTSAPELYRFRIRCRSCRVLRKRKRKAAAQSSFANFVSYADTANSKKIPGDSQQEDSPHYF